MAMLEEKWVWVDRRREIRERLVVRMSKSSRRGGSRQVRWQ